VRVLAEGSDAAARASSFSARLRASGDAAQLWRACEAYLDNEMLEEQSASFELLIRPEFLAVVSNQRLMHEVIAWAKQL
jgi:hypothetical protein